MGPLTLDELREKLGAQHPERKLAVLGQLWEAFRLRRAFLESAGSNSFSATVVADTGVGNLKEVNGLLNLQLTLFSEITASGVRERAESCQLYLLVGDKEYHMTWPASLSDMLEDETFRWVLQRLAADSRPIGVGRQPQAMAA